MASTTIGGLFGGIFLTAILVIVFIILFKIVRRVFVGLENNELEVEDEDGSVNEEGLEGEGGEGNDGDGGGGDEVRGGVAEDDEAREEEKKEEEELEVEDEEEGVDTTNGTLSATEEEEDRDGFWESEIYSPYLLPSRAKYVKTEDKYLQLSLNNQRYLNEHDEYITVKNTNDPYTEQGTSLRFRFHYFDLSKFPRNGGYIMIESEGKFIKNESQTETNHASILLKPGKPPLETMISDDRFFRIQPKINDANKIHFLHLNSGLYLATKGGWTRTGTELIYVAGEPPEKATFVPLDYELS